MTAREKDTRVTAVSSSCDAVRPGTIKGMRIAAEGRGRRERRRTRTELAGLRRLEGTE